MKKIKLKNIIRESIKELVNEQASLPNYGPGVYRSVSLYGCGNNSYTGYQNQACDMGEWPHAHQSNLAYSNLCLYVTDSNGVPFSGFGDANPAIVEYQGQKYRLSGIGTHAQSTCADFGIPVSEPATIVNGCKLVGSGPNAINVSPYHNPNDPVCAAGVTTVQGCTDSTAFNYDPNATQDDGSCDYGFYCKPLGDNPKFGSKCTPANQSNPGPFATLQDCLDSGCELKRVDKDDKTIKEPAGPSITPFTTDPQDMVKPEEDMVKRMQDLANIKK